MTDAEGKFQLNHVPAGRFYIRPLAPAFVPEGSSILNQQGRLITVANGEAIEGLTIGLQRGGVITGRITDASGRPRIQERINLIRIDEAGRRQPFYVANYSMSGTDDRGVYRIYGLPPGQYKVSAGVEPERHYARAGQGDTYFLRTFYPGTTDETKANVVEVTAGSEATDIDISLGRPEKTYTASGRIIDAETGKPVANLVYGYGVLQPDGRSLMSASFGQRSDEKGQFRIEGILAGRYVALISNEDAGGIYGDLTPLQITDADVTNIEIKTHRGSTISGIVILEDADNQAGAAKFSEIRLGAFSQTNMSRGSDIKINPDGSFRATGFPPGKVGFYLNNYPRREGFSVIRIERDGVEQQGSIEVGAGENISGVRLVLAYGSGKLVGRIKLEGVSLTKGARLFVQAQRLGTPANLENRFQTEADERGRFVLEGLLAGEYEVWINALPMGPNRQVPPLHSVKQRVTVNNGAETEVTLVFVTEAKNN